MEKDDKREVWLSVLDFLESLQMTILAALDKIFQIIKEPFILKQPVNFVGNIGDTAIFHVKAANVALYQWQNKGTGNWLSPSLPGVATDTLQAEITTQRLNFVYRCKLTGNDGSVIYTDEVKMQLEE